MTGTTAQCLVFACGNTLRGDDGIGPFLAAWAEEHFAHDPRIAVFNRQQWTAELAEDLSTARLALFLDCSAESAPGQLMLFPVAPAEIPPRTFTHHMTAPELLYLARDFFGSLPRAARMLTIGAGSMELGEHFSAEVTAAIPEARRMIEEALQQVLVEA